MLLFVAKSETFLSKVAAPTSILFFSNNFMYENFEPSFITGPLTPESLIKVFEPAPRMLILQLIFLISSKKLTNCFLSSGRKKISAAPLN